MWKCKKCNEEVDDNFDVCWNCGSDKKGSDISFIDKGEPVVFNEIKEKVIIKKSISKYPALITISWILKIFAVFTGIVAVIIAGTISIANEGWIIALTSIIVGSLSVLLLIAISELIHVFIDIEYNTRNQSKKK